jgi:hypothetical protein
MIKKILDHLAVPLIPYSYYAIIVDEMKSIVFIYIQTEIDPITYVSFLKHTVKQLEPLNSRMLCVITGFLAEVAMYK